MVLAVLRLLMAEWKKGFLTWVRYPIQPIIGLAFVFGLFAALSYGVKAMPALGLFEGGTNEMVVSFFCWVVAMGAIGHVADEIEEDAKRGLLENIFTSRLKASTIVAVRSLSSSIGGLVLSMISLQIFAWYSGASLNIGPAAIAALVVLDIALSGVGMVMAGLGVVTKRVSSVAPMVYLSFGLLIATTISPEPKDERMYYPVLSAVELFSRVLFGHDVELPQVMIAVAWAVVVLVLGLRTFDAMANIARDKGTLAHS